MGINKQVLFSVGEEEYGLDLFSVEDIVRHIPLQPAPTPSKHIAGMIHRRNQAIPVYNLRARFGLPDAPIVTLAIVLVKGMKVALAIDRVLEIVEPEEEEVHIAPPLLRMRDTAYVSQVVRVKGKLVILLDLDTLLTEGEQEKVEAMLQAGKGN